MVYKNLGEVGTGHTTGKPLHYKGSIFHRVMRGFMAQMVIKSTFDDAVAYIGVLLAVTLVGTGFSVAIPPSSLTPLTGDCIAGDFEVSAMWFAIFLSLFFMFNAIMLIWYGRMHLRRDSNLDAHVPTRHLYLIIVWVHCLIVLAVIETSIAFFFLFEVNYTKFHCLPRAFQYGIPSFAVNIGVACSFVIYYVWRTPYKMHDDKEKGCDVYVPYRV